MNLFLVILMVILATVGIFGIRKLIASLKFTAHKDRWVDQYLKFQSMQLLLALVFLGIVYLIAPDNLARFFRIGDLHAPSSGIRWLGIAAGTPWWQIALTMGFWITVGTGIFMFFQLKQVDVNVSVLIAAFPWVILLSAMNAFSEEVIFRLGVVSPLDGILPASVVVLISAALFGIPHYFGTPGGIIGALMAGFLGWLMALSLAETQGIFIAWGVHFVQDVVILSSQYLMKDAQSGRVNP